jgi:hypothetical protein
VFFGGFLRFFGRFFGFFALFGRFCRLLQPISPMLSCDGPDFVHAFIPFALCSV